VGQLTNEECVRRYAAASAAHDLDALAALRHRDWVVFWPQSGERVHGSEAFAEIIANYPGGAPKTEVTRIVGSEDQCVVTAANTAMRVAGSGDYWWSEWRLTYPNGEVYLVVDLLEMRDGQVQRETVYWAAPFEAPAWRAPWVSQS
jgi:ketosteroid isomerase-like protein